MTDQLLYMCIDKFKAMLETCRKEESCPGLPGSFVVYHIKGVKHGGRYIAKQRLRAWRYSDGEVFEIPVDADPVQRPGDELFFCESYAEFGFSRFSKKAFISIYFGESFAMGFTYDVYSNGTEFIITNEKTAWTM